MAAARRFLRRNPITRYPALMDTAISQRIAELRREIEDLNEQARIYRFRQDLGWQDRTANDMRIARLEAILKELDALRSKRWPNHEPHN